MGMRLSILDKGRSPYFSTIFLICPNLLITSTNEAKIAADNSLLGAQIRPPNMDLAISL